MERYFLQTQSVNDDQPIDIAPHHTLSSINDHVPSQQKNSWIYNIANTTRCHRLDTDFRPGESNRYDDSVAILNTELSQFNEDYNWL